MYTHVHMSPTETEKDGMGGPAKSGKQNSEKAGETDPQD